MFGATPVLLWPAIALIGASTALFALVLARIPAVPAPSLGIRGFKRQRALREVDGFRFVDPMIRKIAAWVAPLPIHRYREKTETRLRHAGEYLGLSPDECLALSIMCVFFFALVGALAVYLLEVSPIFACILTVFSAVVPSTRISSETQRRVKEINRGLCSVIDLAALCMGAGLDLPGALRQIVAKGGRHDDALREELRRVLSELELGHTRRQALQAFADRVPSDAVRDFVFAVVQAEQRGTPLAEVLRIQAVTQRNRRSVKAEEAAARAAVLMMLPLLLIFSAIMLLILGPFMVDMRGF